MRSATRQQALGAKAIHSFSAGLGYVAHDSEPMMAVIPGVGLSDCDPPADAADGSLHFLASAQNAASPIIFKWDQQQQVWEREGGNRLGWRPAYLSGQGWRYVSAV